MGEKQFTVFAAGVSIGLYLATPYVMRYALPAIAYNLLRDGAVWPERVAFIGWGAVLFGWISWAQGKRQKMRTEQVEWNRQQETGFNPLQ